MSTHLGLDEKIKYYRKTCGTAQEDFTTPMNVESLHVSNSEWYKKGISLNILLRICKRVNMDWCNSGNTGSVRDKPMICALKGYVV